MLWHPKTLQNLAMYNVFFHFWPFFHCRKATKMTQNSISIPSCAQTPKNPRKMSKTPPYSGLGAKPFLGPPPAKADIATAILTNVIEHLVLLFCPPISTPSPPKRCGRIYLFRQVLAKAESGRILRPDAILGKHILIFFFFGDSVSRIVTFDSVGIVYFLCSEAKK